MAQRSDTYFRNQKPGDKPAKYTDSNGLFLLVQPNGTRLWRYRYRIAGKENVCALGDYSTMKLQAAREARDAARRLVKEGIHPAQHRKASRLVTTADSANTFEAVAREWISQRQQDWSDYYSKQVINTLEADVFPSIGGMPIRKVSAAHLLSIVKKVEGRPAPTVAILIRQWASAIFCYAVATLRADQNPAAALKGSVNRPKTKHKQPLLQSEIPLLLSRVDASKATPTVKIALRLLMYTFVRPGELRGAYWSEFDLGKAQWRIPGARMKMGDDHVVPLSTQAVVLLDELRSLGGSRATLFSNTRDPTRVMSNTTLNRLIERLGFAGTFSSHGFRATASTYLNEVGFKPDAIERQLAHQERSKTRRTYNQATYLAERTTMMQHWADYLDSSCCDESKVVPIKSRKRR